MRRIIPSILGINIFLSKIHDGNVSPNSASHSILINIDGVADIEDRDEGLSSAHLLLESTIKPK